MQGLIFDGYNVPSRQVRYRGHFGHEYLFDTFDTKEVFTFVHGDRVVIGKDSACGVPSGRQVTVVGSHDGALWVHDEAQGGAFALRGAKSFAELIEKFAPQLVTDSVSSARRFTTQATNEIGYRCAYNCDNDELFSRFGVRAGDSFVTTIPEKKEVTVVGILFNCLWVATIDNPREAIPLPRATAESTLLSLYRVCQKDKVGLSPRVAVTPRTAARTSAYKLNPETQSAECTVSFGNKIVVSTSTEALSIFGPLTHGQKFYASRGEFAGKPCTVIGVHNGCLYIYCEGDKRVTCLRNVSNADELAQLVGLGQQPVALTNPGTPVRGRSLESPTLLQHRERSSSATPRKNFWTASGRAAVDISPSACSPFGFTHGDVVKCTTGPNTGDTFYVAGVHQGVLWVVGEGKSRAIPLRHCFSAEDIDRQWKFLKVGKRNLEFLMQLDTEPPSTPLPKSDQDLPTPRSLAGRSDSSPKMPPPKVPTLNLGGAVGPVSAALPQTPKADSKLVEPGAMPLTRHFLKAYALLQSNVNAGEAQQAQVLQAYYTVDTCARLGAGLKAMQTFVAQCSKTGVSIPNHTEGILQLLLHDRRLYL